MEINRRLVDRLERQRIGVPRFVSAWLADNPTNPLAMRVEERAGGWLVKAVPGANWGGGGYGLGFEGPITEQDFHAIVTMAREVGTRFRIVVCPYSDISLMNRLTTQGWRCEGFRTLLARPLTTDPRDADACGPPDPTLVVREIHLDTELDLFTNIMHRAFTGEGPPGEADATMSRINTRCSGAHSYLAWLGDRPVGSARLELAGGVAFFNGGAVLPEFRRRGVHRAMILARWRRAQAQGCDLAVIASLAGGPTERSAQRLGFQVAYTSPELFSPYPAPPLSQAP